MFIELHMIQNIPPANLNRDDSGAPKDCEFGGHRRARISSQSLKRAIRFHDDMRNLEGASPSQRTKRIVEQVVDRLVNGGHDKEKAESIVKIVMDAAGVSTDDKGKSSILFFINDAAMDCIAQLIHDHFEDLDQKKKKDIPGDVVNEIVDIFLEEIHSPDLALFGRMVAVDPKSPLGAKNLKINAACQVAHAISTNRVSMDEDFFTAVDDLNPDEETGAGMMGVIDFNSSCFYRYSVIDTRALEANLGHDQKLAENTVHAFIKASVESLPSGKQNSFAAHTRPDFVLAIVRKGQPLSLANSFANPVRPWQNEGMVEASVKAMYEHLKKLTETYGDGDLIEHFWIYTKDLSEEDKKRWEEVFGFKDESLETLIGDTIGQAFPEED